MLDDLAISRKLILLCYLLAVFCLGVTAFVSGCGLHHESGAGYSYATATVAPSLGTTAISLLISILSSLYLGRPKIDRRILRQSMILFVMCPPICLCQYLLFLDGQLSAMGKTLEGKIVDAAGGIGLYMLLLFSFYGILWRILRRTVETKNVAPIDSPEGQGNDGR